MFRTTMIGLLSLFGVSLTWASQEIAPAIERHTREHPVLFDDGGLPAVVEFRNHPDRAGEIAIHRRVGDSWSTGAELEMSTGNMVMLQDAGQIDGHPALVFLYDQTDYIGLMGLDRSLPFDTPYPGDQNELLSIMDQARRVNVSMQVQGRWTAPIGVPGTRGAKRATLVEGASTALLLVVKDSDGHWNTASDEELFATVWNEETWSEPIQLTYDAVAEQGLSGAWTEQGFVVAWGSDADGDPATPEDRQIFSARIGEQGQLLDGPSAVSGVFTAALPPHPVVVRRTGEAAVLWLAGGADNTSPLQLMEATLNGGWLVAPVSSLHPYHGSEVRVQPSPLGDDMLVVREGPRFRVALADSDGWHLSEPLVDFASEGLVIREWDAMILDGTLHVAVTGASTPGGDVGASTSEALWHAEVPLGPDVQVLRIMPERNGVAALEAFDARVTVRNVGGLPAEDVSLELYGVMVGGREEVLNTLRPGEQQTLRVTVALADGAHRWGVRLTHSGEDLNPLDNVLELPSPADPDFEIVSIRMDGEHISMDVRENSGIGSGPVDVEVYLQRESGTELLGTLNFDPRDPRILELNAPALVGVEPPYRLLARVNPDRSVAESEYSNNMETHQDLGLVDLRVLDAFVDGDRVIVEVLAEQGTVREAVGVRLSTSPTDATASLKSGWAGDDVILIELDQDGRGRAELEIPDSTAEFLYAVVNPGNEIREPSRENNMMRFSPSRHARVESDLTLIGRDDRCGVMRVRVRNSGMAPALGSILTIVNEDGLPVLERTLPVVAVGDEAVVELPGLTDGRYTAVLKRLDRVEDQRLDSILDSFSVHETLDWDQDGYNLAECGGNDCDDRDADVFPGSKHYDDQCLEKIVVGCGGCASGPGSVGLGLWLVALGASARRRPWRRA